MYLSYLLGVRDEKGGLDGVLEEVWSWVRSNVLTSAALSALVVVGLVFVVLLILSDG